jgi:hypothetical protein
MRIFGIGKQTQWSQDTVTVSIRAVSVNTGKVLAVVTVQKTILSTADSATALKFFDQGTQAFEAEAGLTINEPGTYAVKAAIEMAVVELIKEGQRKSLWDYRHEPVTEVIIPKIQAPLVLPTTPAPVISSEIRKPEEKKDELVPTQAPKESAPSQESPAAAPQQSNDRQVPAGVEGKSETIKEEKLVTNSVQTGLKLKENAYLYAQPKDTSTKKWWVSKGTELSIKQPETDGWWKVVVVDGTGRGGWVQSNKLEKK